MERSLHSCLSTSRADEHGSRRRREICRSRRKKLLKFCFPWCLWCIQIITLRHDTHRSTPVRGNSAANHYRMEFLERIEWFRSRIQKNFCFWTALRDRPFFDIIIGIFILPIPIITFIIAPVPMMGKKKTRPHLVDGWRRERWWGSEKKKYCRSLSTALIHHKNYLVGNSMGFDFMNSTEGKKHDPNGVQGILAELKENRYHRVFWWIRAVCVIIVFFAEVFFLSRTSNKCAPDGFFCSPFFCPESCKWITIKSKSNNLIINK